MAVIRDEIAKYTINNAFLIKPKIGYIKLDSFAETRGQELRDALKKLDYKSLDGLIFDLRANPGGLLTQAVRVSDEFIDSGLVVYTDGRLENQKQKYFAHKAGSHTDFPMIALVNGGSASASEIVAGCLQDHKRALVLGTQTFGKGSVQTILPLEESAAIRLTTARYYTPNGRSIQATGITPDIIVDNSIVEAKADGSSGFPAVREENLPRHFEHKGKTPENGTPKTGEEPEAVPEVHEGELGKDPQLDRALELLKSWNVFKTVIAKNDS